MKNALVVFGLVFLFPIILPAQKKTDKSPAKKVLNIPMTPEHWEVQPGKVEFGKHKNVDSLKIQQNGGMAILKNVDFTIGTIEFDAEPLDAVAVPFVTSYFRFQKDGESEVFYLRVGREENHKRNDAIQYAPMIKGVNLWDMLPHLSRAVGYT